MIVIDDCCLRTNVCDAYSCKSYCAYQIQYIACSRWWLAELQRSSLNIHFIIWHDCHRCRRCSHIRFTVFVFPYLVEWLIRTSSFLFVLYRRCFSLIIPKTNKRLLFASQDGEFLDKNVDWIYEWSSRPDQAPPKYDPSNLALNCINWEAFVT